MIISSGGSLGSPKDSVQISARSEGIVFAVRPMCGMPQE
jgi:hypothetical protein